MTINIVQPDCWALHDAIYPTHGDLAHPQQPQDSQRTMQPDCWALHDAINLTPVSYTHLTLPTKLSVVI